MPLIRTIALVGRTENEQRTRGHFSSVAPAVGKMRFKNQAIASAKKIDLLIDFILQGTFKAIN